MARNNELHNYGSQNKLYDKSSIVTSSINIPSYKQLAPMPAIFAHSSRDKTSHYYCDPSAFTGYVADSQLLASCDT